MICRIRELLLSWLMLAALATSGADYQTQADLLLDHEVAAPGQTIMAGVRLKMPAGWHTYWRNPGDSGMATKITWQLPRGVTAGDIQWPVPEKHDFEGFITYVYHDVVVLRVPLTISADAPLGPTEIRASLEWLECKETCIPGKGQVSAELTLAREPRKSGNAAILDDWEKRLPAKSEELKVVAHWQDGESPEERQLILSATTPAGVKLTDFFPYLDPAVEIGAATEVLSETATEINLRKTVMRFGDAAWPQSIAGILTTKTGAAAPAYEFTAAISDEPARALTGGTATGSGVPASGPAPAVSFWQMLLYAFVGGLILNIMPCVLPVIALKILGFVQQNREAPGQMRLLGVAYGIGVLCSFLALAGVIMAIKATGQAVGWGMQFQNPQFVVLLTVLVLLVALNFFGLYEITLSGRAMTAAGSASGAQGIPGAFFNGVLATLLGTPCTAPFLAPALGFAIPQPASVIIPLFLTIGCGLAFPYVLLCFQPNWLKFLPKPGAWMDTFKKVMGFPMLATALWLYTVAFPRFGEEGSLWLGLFLVLVSLSVWVWGQFVQLGRSKRRVWAGATALALLALSYFFLLEGQLHWRNPKPASANGAGTYVSGGITWEPWSHEAIARARQAGRPVFVDFTARWCPNCIVNKKTSLEIDPVRAKITETGALMLRADYTDYDARITEELERFNRSAIPMNLVYPADPNLPPEVLPPTLTPGIVLDALDKAATAKKQSSP